MTVPIQAEDHTTEMLATLLNSDAAIMPLFLRFLFPKTEDRRRWERLPLQVETQHITSHGKKDRLDLLLHADGEAIIIECKTKALPKIYQLEKYYKYWSAKHGNKPAIFWLVRKVSENMGINAYLTHEFLWDDLYRHLQGCLQRPLARSAFANITKFCSYLEAAKILLQPNERQSYKPRHRGYEYAYAEDLLATIGREFRDSVFEVTPPMNGVTHRLFIGRKAWREKFEDGWIERVTLQFKVDEESGRFFWHAGIMMYNKHNIPDPSFAIRKFPAWAMICKNAGLKLRRNLSNKWSGKHGYELEPPFVITRPVLYFGASLPKDTWPQKLFEVNQANEAVAEAVRILQYIYALVDKF